MTNEENEDEESTYCLCLDGIFDNEFYLKLYSDLSINKLNSKSFLEKELNYKLYSFEFNKENTQIGSKFVIKKISLEYLKPKLNNIIKFKVAIQSQFSKYYDIYFTYSNESCEFITEKIIMDEFYSLIVNNSLSNVVFTVVINDNKVFNTASGEVNFYFKCFEVNSSFKFNSPLFSCSNSDSDSKIESYINYDQQCSFDNEFNIIDNELIDNYDILDFYKEDKYGLLFKENMYFLNNSVVNTSLFISLTREKLKIIGGDEKQTGKKVTRKNLNAIGNETNSINSNFLLKPQNLEVIKIEEDDANNDNDSINELEFDYELKFASSSNNVKFSNEANILPKSLNEILFYVRITKVFEKSFYKSIFIENITLLDKSISDDTPNNKTQTVKNKSNKNVQEYFKYNNRYVIECYFKEKVIINYIKWKITLFSTDTIAFIKETEREKHIQSLFEGMTKQYTSDHHTLFSGINKINPPPIKQLLRNEVAKESKQIFDIRMKKIEKTNQQISPSETLLLKLNTSQVRKKAIINVSLYKF